MNRNNLTAAILVAMGLRSGVIAPAFRTLVIGPDGIGTFLEYPYYGYKAG